MKKILLFKDPAILHSKNIELHQVSYKFLSYQQFLFEFSGAISHGDLLNANKQINDFYCISFFILSKYLFRDFHFGSNIEDVR